jgi:hypothetical protein
MGAAAPSIEIIVIEGIRPVGILSVITRRVDAKNSPSQSIAGTTAHGESLPFPIGIVGGRTGRVSGRRIRRGARSEIASRTTV